MSTDTMSREERAETTPASRRRWPRRLGIVTASVGAVAALVWVGLRANPGPLPDPALEPGDVPTQALPRGLPAPVARFYSTIYGDRVPVVTSAVVSGRGDLRIGGVTFPARFRFSHITGQDYRHHLELTAFGRTLTTVSEWYVDGHARMELPFGVSEGPNVDQGANLALWAEAVWMPSVWVTDPGVRWEPIDDTSARLIVPWDGREEAFTVAFDPATGLLRRLESMRFKGETDDQRTLWINEVSEWGGVSGHHAPLRADVTWADEGTPWARFRTEDVLYNADLSEYVRAEGP